jgi:flagellar biosynthesis/type III secretory pathway protein FliH
MNAKEIDDLLAEIAREHKVILGQDDPILILWSVNRFLLKELATNQVQITREFREIMESTAADWHNRSRKQAEGILNAALAAAKNALASGVEAGLQTGSASVVRAIAESVQRMEALQGECRKMANQQRIMAMVSIVSLAGALVLLFFRR